MSTIREDYDIESGYYVHKEKLGEGGFSKVRLGTHLLTGEKVAIKCMDKNKLGADVIRIKTEINALKILDHPFIAKLLQVIETKDNIYLVLEYCSGGELFDYIVAKSRLSERESQKIISCLIQCLAYLHGNGFAHRDLKPENILFDANHNIKLIDFGLAAQSRDNISLNQLRTCCGSPAYAAPELISGSKYSGPAVDVWSAGVILYAILVGQLPFDDDNITNLYKKIQSGRYRTPTWLSTPSKSILSAMLQTDPSRRITIKELLHHPWIRPSIQIDYLEIQKETFDDEILWQVHKYFPTSNYSELRTNILKKFGYQTATYWLLKQKKYLAQVSLQNIRCQVLKNVERSAPLSTPQNTKMFVKQKRDRELKPVEPVEKEPSSADKKKIELMDNGIISPIMDAYKPSTPTVRVEPTPRPTNEIGSSIKVPINKRPPLRGLLSPCDSPNAPKKRKMFENVKSSPTKPKSSPYKENFRTPLKTMPATKLGLVTPKKSLLKKILQTATPSTNKAPRNITASAPTTTKNITMTKFNDPQLCIDNLIKALSEKGIECKQKGFVIRCAMTNKHPNTLTFNLEICLFGDRCVIQRKRLRGDAWNYKKICEEILRISNETCV